MIDMNPCTKLQKWNEKIDKEIETVLNEKYKNMRQKREKGNVSLKVLDFKRKSERLKDMDYDAKIKELNVKKIPGFQKYLRATHTFQNLKDIFLSQKEYYRLLHIYELKNEVDQNIEILNQKELEELTDQEFTRIIQTFQKFDHEVSMFSWIFPNRPNIKMQEEFLTKEHMDLIENYHDLEDIFLECAKKKQTYSTYEFLATILWTFKKIGSEQEQEEDKKLQENPEYLIGRDIINVLYFDRDTLEKLRANLIKELTDISIWNRENKEQHDEKIDALQNIDEYLLCKKKGRNE